MARFEGKYSAGHGGIPVFVPEIFSEAARKSISPFLLLQRIHNPLRWFQWVFWHFLPGRSN
jgi:hypothetical protein